MQLAQSEGSRPSVNLPTTIFATSSKINPFIIVSSVPKKVSKKPHKVQVLRTLAAHNLLQLSLSHTHTAETMAATTAATFTLSKLLKSSTPKSFSLLSPKRSNLFTSSSSFSPLPLKFKQPHHPLQSLKHSTISRISATISVGDKLPNCTLSYFDSSDELKTLLISDLTNGKKVVLLAVPGAFTPTCSQKHLPGFVEKSKELKSKGVDTIACISVNDAFVMKYWKENLGINDEVMMLSDGNLEFTKAIGCELDLSDKPVGLGIRSRRYSMLVDDGVVKILNLEEGGAFNVSSAEDILKAL